MTGAFCAALSAYGSASTDRGKSGATYGPIRPVPAKEKARFMQPGADLRKTTKGNRMPAKGGVTVPLNWCVFSGFDSLLHDTIRSDLDLLKRLPNVYAVCIAERNSDPKRIVGGFFVRTSYAHNNAEFPAALAGAMAAIPAFEKFAPQLHSFLPARVAAPLDITEEEMLTLLLSQKLKFTTGGSA